MFADADRIYRVNMDIKAGNSQAHEFARTPAILAEYIDNDFSEVELTTRLRIWGSSLIRKKNTTVNSKELHCTYVDSTFLKMFGIKLLVGDIETALKLPNTLVLTKTAAEKHFGVNEALGQTLILNNTETFTVTGVIEDLPNNSFLRGQTVFMAMAGAEASRSVTWSNNNFHTYIKLIPSANVENIQEPLRGFLGKYIMPDPTVEKQFKDAGNHWFYSTTPITDIHLYSNREYEINVNSDIKNIYILSFIAIFLIVIACVNFMNLSTAHSLKRAKEVGVRKTLGSNKGELIRQFLIESGLISFSSLLLAIIIAIIALPFFNDLADKAILIPYSNPFFWLILFSSGVLLAFLSGSYPAFFMSKFIPVKVLKGSGSNHIGGEKVRSKLVIFQFTISIFLIIGTLVVYQQLKYIQNKDLGFSKDQVLIINDAYILANRITSFKEEVKKLGFVKNATLSSFLPTPSNRSDSTFRAADQENTVDLQRWGVDHDYISTLNYVIIAGRNFNKQIRSDSTSIIINETAVALMGVSPKKAIGLQYTKLSNNTKYTIIGVLKDFHFSSLRDKIDPLSLHLNNRAYSLAIKLTTNNLPNAISNVENIWNEMTPGQPFDYYFMEDSFNNTFQSEQRLSRIFFIFTTLSILIACLGLFGLAAFNAEKRTKEIGVRKVLGASVGQITYKLAIDFLKLVGIAILISFPISWYAMNKWLEGFSYHIDIHWGVFILASLLAIIVSILTISYQSIKAAIANPIKALRDE